MAKFDRALYEEKFIGLLKKRLKEGEIQYDDKSFARPLRYAIAEIQEELADVAGWAFIGWTKLERLRKRMEDCDVDNLWAPDE